jgi:CubicO group peptidase (beta-lactamase class C family)
LLNKKVSDQLQACVAQVRGRFDAPGIAVGISNGHETFTAGAGVSSTLTGDPMSPHRRIPISCVIKPLVAWFALYSAANGVIDLDEDIANLVPKGGLGAAPTSITLRHLLTHTAGYIEPQENYARWGYTWDRFQDFFPRRKQAFSPGAVWSYAHTGYAVVQAALEHVLGKPLESLLNEVLLDPLGIDLRSYDTRGTGKDASLGLHVRHPRTGAFEVMRVPPETGFLRFSISDLALTTEQLAQVGAALAGAHAARLSHLEPARQRLLSRAIEIPVFNRGSKGELMPQAFCHGVADYGSFKGINGSYVGSTCAVRIGERHQMGIAATVNAYEPHTRDVASTVVAAPFEAADARPAPRRGAVFADLDQLVGRYEGMMLGSADAQIVRRGEGIVCMVNFKRGAPSHGYFVPDETGRLKLASGSPEISTAFFESPDDGEPVLMCSMSAFKKESGQP